MTGHIALIGGKVLGGLGGGGFVFSPDGGSTSQAATPTFSPAAGSYSTAQTVTISCATSGSTIYYTTNGSTPTTASTVYSTPITVSVSETVQAIATASGYSQSAVGSAAYTITSGATQVFNYTSFSSSNDGSLYNLVQGGGAAYSGNVVEITQSEAHGGGTFWTHNQVNIQSFTTTFTFNFTPAYGTGSDAATCAFFFVVQNSNSSTNAYTYGNTASGDANVGGYGSYSKAVNQYQEPIGNSIGIKFDISGPSAQYGYKTGGQPNSTALMIDGGPFACLAPFIDLNPYNINLNSANEQFVTIVYDGSYLTMVIKDTVTNAQARMVWPLNNLTSIITQNTAWAGMTCGTVGGSVGATLYNWAYYTGYSTRLVAPTFSVASGTYASTQTVSISASSGATIYYTTNGLLPTSASTQYTSALTVSANTVINAVAIESGYTDSYVSTASYVIGTSTPLINYPSGFAANDGVTLVGHAAISGSSIVLTDNNTTQPLGQVSAAWYPAQVNIQTFTNNFSVQFASSGTTYGGMTFCIQVYAQYSPFLANEQIGTTGGGAYVSGGPYMAANYGESFGYGYISAGTGTGQSGGFVDSVAITLYPNNNSSGLYTDGAFPSGSDTAITGVTLTSGHLMNVSMSYNGTTLTMTIFDTVTSATSNTLSWTVNIPSVVGSNVAYVGFTAGNANDLTQTLEKWTYTITSGATQVFNYTSFNTSQPLSLVGGNSQIVSGAIQLGGASGYGGHTGGAAYYETSQNMSLGFTTKFAFAMPGATLGQAQGITFMFNNTSSPPGASGFVGLVWIGDANGCGYGGYDASSQNDPFGSCAVKFDISALGQHGYPNGGYPNGTGLFINGGPFDNMAPYNDLNPYSINIFSGDTFLVTLVYDGSVLTMTVLDETTNAQGRYVWNVNIPAAVTNSNSSLSANHCYVGITCGEIPNNPNYIYNWSYSTGYNTRLATPTFSVAAGEYSSTQSVTISYPSGSTCYYTTNGLLPTSSSTQYTGAISVSANTLLQAVAIESGYTDSYVGSVQYQIGTSNIVNFPSGFSSGDGVVITGSATYSGSSILLMPSAIYDAAAGAWWGAPVNIQTFTSSATLEFGSGDSQAGTTFCIHNLPQSTSTPLSQAGTVSGCGSGPSCVGGPTTVGNGSISFGYGVLDAAANQSPAIGGLGFPTNTAATNGTSCCVSFNLGNNSVGFYTNGVIPTGADTTITGGLSLTSGHAITAALVYNGTTLTLTLTDTVNSDSFNHSWTENIPSIVGANIAYVGFTAGSGSGCNQTLAAWTYHN